MFGIITGTVLFHLAWRAEKKIDPEESNLVVCLFDYQELIQGAEILTRKNYPSIQGVTGKNQSGQSNIQTKINQATHLASKLTDKIPAQMSTSFNVFVTTQHKNQIDEKPVDMTGQTSIDPVSSSPENKQTRLTEKENINLNTQLQSHVGKMQDTLSNYCNKLAENNHLAADSFVNKQEQNSHLEMKEFQAES